MAESSGVEPHPEGPHSFQEWVGDLPTLLSGSARGVEPHLPAYETSQESVPSHSAWRKREELNPTYVKRTL